jgi:DNA polymerase-1
MTTKKGEMVNAVYGFIAALLKAIREFKPEYVVLTLDKRGATFRHEEYEEYKARRPKQPDELYEQIPRVKEVARAFNIPIYEKSGLEADDLIGTIVKKTDGQLEKIILTGDLDTLQLVDGHTKVYTMSRGLSDSVTYDEEAVRERYGLIPSQMIDYKALRGDTSDNIPGVRGIGEKTAVALLRLFKTLDGVYEYIENKKTRKQENKIKPRIIELLKLHKKDAYLSKKLATIKCDAKINFKLDDARFGNFDRSKVVKLFSELEFKSLLPRVQELSKKQENNKTEKQKEELSKFERNKSLFKYNLIDNDKKFKIFLAKLKAQKQFTFDTETSSFDPLTADLLGISFSWKEGEAHFVRVKSEKLKVESHKVGLFNYKDSARRDSVSTVSTEETESLKNKWLNELKPIFENQNIKKFGHNIKFDIRVMKNNRVDVQGIEFDTMVASYLLSPGTRQHNLDALTFAELGHEKITKEDLLGSAYAKATADKKGSIKILKSQIGFADVETEKLSLYSCEDADFTHRLVKKLQKRLKAQKLDKLFHELEMPLVPVLAEMEDNGIKIDSNFLGKIKKEVGGKIKKLEEKIKKMAGADFNINSTQQLRQVLFEKLEIPSEGVSRNKTGLSTSADELEKLKDLHPIIRYIQQYRELTKLANTYIDALPELVNKKTGRLHTSFNQTITATGRLSSSDPNLQNIPIRTELGRRIREAFVADKGYKLVSLDYSQIELRLAAHMSGDAKMIKAFKDGIDIHTATAAEINRVPLSSVDYKMRREAKAINFGILYGQGPHGLAQGADIPYARAKEFIDKYFAAHKDVKRFIDKTIVAARKKGYVETLFGRRRYLPEINSSVLQVRKAAERMAINAPLQGTAADMIKAAMIEISRMLKGGPSSKLEAKLPAARMLLQVHDELLFEIKEDKVKEIAQEIKRIMEGVLKLKVPIVVDVSVGDNWGEMESLELRIKN